MKGFAQPPAPKRHVKRAQRMSRCRACGADREPFRPCQFGCSQDIPPDAELGLEMPEAE